MDQVVFKSFSPNSSPLPLLLPPNRLLLLCYCHPILPETQKLKTFVCIDEGEGGLLHKLASWKRWRWGGQLQRFQLDRQNKPSSQTIVFSDFSSGQLSLSAPEILGRDREGP